VQLVVVEALLVMVQTLLVKLVALGDSAAVAVAVDLQVAQVAQEYFTFSTKEQL
jgi:hypothetical protein